MEQKTWYQKTTQEALMELGSSAENGLDAGQAEARLAEDGPNALRQAKKRTIWQMLLDQFKDFMILILLVAAVVSGLLGEISDCVIILLVVVVNAVIGVVQENRAEHSLEALRKMSSVHAKVIRDGKPTLVEAEALVKGDVVQLETGDSVPADLRLVECINLQVQESALTGESQPVEKHTDTIDGEVGVGDRVNMAFSSSLVTYGHGKGVVVETGMGTEIGHIAGMIEGEEGMRTPLQRRLAAMSKTLAWACLGICGLIFVVGLLYGKSPLDMFMEAVSLAVAAIPEGLPATVTVVLAMGVMRMSRKNAIIRRLPAVETLGSATVICSDKTGTLTQNKMTVVRAMAPLGEGEVESFKHQPDWMMLVTAAVLCNDGQLGSNKEGETVWLGDPTETALLAFGQQLGFERPLLERQFPRVDEIPFDSDRKLMTTVHRDGKALRAYTKGAVDELLPRCTHIQEKERRPLTEAERERILQRAAEMSEDAIRVLAFATGELETTQDAEKGAAYEQGLTFLGMTGMVDPIRPEAKDAVERCLRAGIKPVMITGDHQVTAAAIARELGIMQPGDTVLSGAELEAMDDEQLYGVVQRIAVYARVSPEHKLRIVKAWQRHGDVVAMTGDGVNDAPALKRADIGIAMGITGTEVSKEAAAMILADDNYATIVTAVEEGRTIYANILKVIQFLLGANIGEILVIFLATILNWDSPLLPVHLLWVNLVTDSLPALALGVDPAMPDVMDKPPQDPKAPLFSPSLVYRIAYSGVMIAALTLAAFLLGQPHTHLDTARTMAFATLAFAQMVHTFNVRSDNLSIFRIGLGTNRTLLLAMLGSIALQVLVMCVPFLRGAFKLAVLSPAQWGMVAGLSLAPLLVVEVLKALKINSIGKRKK